MTVLTSNPSGGFSLPQTLTQGQSYMGGIVNYDSATGKPLAPGATTLSSPSYSNLVASPPDQNGAVPTPLAPVNPTTVSFTQALLQILKDAQDRNSAGQSTLTAQSNQIKGQGLADAAANFQNPLLAPSSGTSLGMSAQNAFDPATGAIEKQQTDAKDNLSNITDIIKQSSSDYNAEQDRIQKANEAAAKPANMTFDTQGNIAHQTSAFELLKNAPYVHSDGTMKSDNDGYVSPQAWQAALTNWQANGGSYTEFVSNFKRYVNPDSYDLLGLGTGGGA